MTKLKLFHEHSWNVSPAAAVDIQKRLQGLIIKNDQLDAVDKVAGVDVGFEEDGKITRAAVVVLELPSLQITAESIARRDTVFPYIPGLLSFRELPAVLDAMKKLEHLPDLLLCDGQGIAHPRRFGIASHLGLLTGIPSIGVGKTRLTGTHSSVPDRRGAWRPLMDSDEIIGAVLRTRAGVKPIYVSIGHRISLETAIGYVMACTTRFKLPETTRMAHKYAS